MAASAAHEFLKALAIVLGVAGLTTVLFQRLRQPVIFGYILAGLVVGPHLPFPLVADRAIVQTLSELGVILLMFSLGLELSLGKLLRVGVTAGLTAVLESSLMLWLGFLAGRLLGFTTLECAFTGALVAISSTTIVAKAFDEAGVTGRGRDLVVGVLVVEDLVAILVLAVLTLLASGGGLSPGALAATAGRLGAFLAGMVAVGMLVVPRTIRWVNRLGRRETTLVASLGICFGAAHLAASFGYSVALGAFIAGSLVAESGEAERVEAVVEPVRDMFGAIFFVSVGMLIDPVLVARHAGAVALLAALVVAGKLLGVSAGAFLTGNGVRASVQAGMSMAQIGEFSFIIAGLGLSLGATRDFLYPVAVAVSAITILTTPWLIRASGPAAAWVDRKLPARLQTFAALYGSWVDRLRATPAERGLAGRLRRMAAWVAVDAGLIAVLIIGAAVEGAGLSRLLQLPPPLARGAVWAAAVALVLPLALGLVRVVGRMGALLVGAALPPAQPGSTDLAAAPRRALSLGLQAAILLLVALVLAAVTQPFLPGAPGLPLLGVLAAAGGLLLWRRADDLQGHARAGAEAIVDALARQARSPAPGGERAAEALGQLRRGLGEPVLVRLGAGDAAVGRSLAELGLREATGATVLAVARGREVARLPAAHEPLQAGDLLLVAGDGAALSAARRLLGPGAAPDGPPRPSPG